MFGHDNRLGRECASYTSPELSGVIDADAATALQATFDTAAVALKGLLNG